MKKSLMMVLAMLVLVLVVGGCATKGDLKEAQAREMVIDAKADQASQDAQAAKEAADKALLKADDALARAEAAEQRAAERERAADEKARQADAVFKRSMKK